MSAELLHGTRALVHPLDRRSLAGEWWLPDPNGFANSEKREQSALTTPSGHVSVRKAVGFGTKQDGNSNSFGVRAGRSCELRALWLTGKGTPRQSWQPRF